MADTTFRKHASAFVHVNIPNLTKQMLHISLGMSRATVCWVFKQNNATGSVTPKEKKNVAKNGFPSREKLLLLPLKIQDSSLENKNLFFCHIILFFGGGLWVLLHKIA